VGEGSFEAGEVGCLRRWCGMDVGFEEAVVLVDGVHCDFEVGNR
jgi:hypothetical protein